MMTLVYYILERMKEKSTWVALGSVVTAMGVGISPENWQAIMAFGMGIPGLVSIFLPARVNESGVKTDPPKGV